MFKFSHISKQRLSTCHPDLQVLFNSVIRSYDCFVACGHRGEAEQNKAYEEGNSQLKFPQSKHNSIPSLAVDVVPYEEGQPDWSHTQSAFFAGYVLGMAQDLYDIGEMTHKIRCGVDWNMDNDVNDTKFWDAAHFEIVPNKTDV